MTGTRSAGSGGSVSLTVRHVKGLSLAYTSRQTFAACGWFQPLFWHSSNPTWLVLPRLFRLLLSKWVKLSRLFHPLSALTETRLPKNREPIGTILPSRLLVW
jgi:hypothetical protein